MRTRITTLSQRHPIGRLAKERFYGLTTFVGRLNSRILKCCSLAIFILLSSQINAAEPKPVKGLKCVFLAPRVPASFESSMVGIHKRLPLVAKKAGISGHSQIELTLDRDDKKRAAEITAALSSGPIDLLALTVSAKETIVIGTKKGDPLTKIYKKIPGILGNASQCIPIMDQAVKINPKMQFLILVPGPVNIPVRKVSELKWSGDQYHKIAYEAIVKKMRARYPSNRIICAYYGRSSSELKTRFEAGDLPGIADLVGEKGVFRNKAGQPGPILDDINAMLTLSIIYDVDLRKKDLGLGYKAKLGPMLKTILRFEIKHREYVPEPFEGPGPNIYTPETWEPPWGYTVAKTDKKGVNAIAWGHKFFIPLLESTTAFAKESGIKDQTIKTHLDPRKRPFEGGPGVGAQLLFEKDKGKAGNLLLDLAAKKYDLVCLTYHQNDTGKLRHYKKWFDSILAQNPKARLLIHLPASFDPVRRDLRIFNKTGDAIPARFYKEIVLPMRALYPNKEIIFWSSGRVNSELRRRFEEGKLPQVKQLVGPRGIFAVKGGFPGPLLKDLEGLILYSLIYKIDLAKKMTGQKGKLDLNALAAEMIAIEKAKGL
jgi:hypothetical protein